jgi:hypothetical protein
VADPAVTIDAATNLVVPIEDASGATLYVHATPLARAVFERYYLVMGKAFATIHDEGLAVIAGPRLAAKVLRSTAERMGIWEDPPGRPELVGTGVRSGLMAEIRRGATVLVPSPAGWRQAMLDSDEARRALGEEDLDEAENALVFFILTCALNRRKTRRALLRLMGALWDAQIVSSSASAFAASLPTSTPVGTSPASPPPGPSSVPT